MIKVYTESIDAGWRCRDNDALSIKSTCSIYNVKFSEIREPFILEHIGGLMTKSNSVPTYLATGYPRIKTLYSKCSFIFMSL